MCLRKVVPRFFLSKLSAQIVFTARSMFWYVRPRFKASMQLALCLQGDSVTVFGGRSLHEFCVHVLCAS